MTIARRAVVSCTALGVALALAPATLALTRLAVTRHTASRSADPLAGETFYDDPSMASNVALRRLRAEGRRSDAALVSRIASKPQAIWLQAYPDLTSMVSSLERDGEAVDRVPVFVTYDIPDRDCGGYSAGGARSRAAYSAWVAKIVRGMGQRPAVVIVEPDAVADVVSDDCLSRSATKARLSMIAAEVKALDRDRDAHVYIDAGNSAWVQDLPKLASALEKAGVAHADGFALNVSNFQTTRASEAYGARLSKDLGGKHFVIDTSRNGEGPEYGADHVTVWCNPENVALGHAPTTDTGDRLVDAFLWVKQPGQSDGACKAGEPAAGKWWLKYALRIASRS